ncbi:MAG: TonB-dependent receptor [Chitinophagaceae bacterium]|nr:TonB-dependent receptor [Chitinophagaceae bacterium]
MRIALILIIILSFQYSWGQVTISGRITNEDKKPVKGASISLKDTYDGATSDSLGYYKFTTSEKGKQVFIVSCLGYENYTDTILIQEQSIEKNATIHREATRMEAVVITVGTFEAGDKNKSAELSTMDVVTTANANADITSAIKTLPGSQQVGEKDGLFVRGGTGKETKIFIDGTLVNNFYYTSEPGQATRGRFNPFLFTGTIFSSGGYSALYGQAMSSVLLLESIDLPEGTSADLGISYLGFNGGIQKLAKNKKSSWGLSYGYTNLQLANKVIKPKSDYFKTPNIHELNGNFRIKTGRGMIKYYLYLSSSKLGFRNPDIDSAGLKNAFSLTNFNMYHNLSWKQKLGKGWKMQLGGSYSTNRDKIGGQLLDEHNQDIVATGNPLYDYKTFHLNNKGYYANGRWVLEKNLGGLSALRFGNEYNYTNDLMEYTAYDGQKSDIRIKENLLASYAESDIYLMPKLALRAGVRAEHSQLLSLWNAAPRLSLAYQFKDRGQVSMAYGKFYQTPDMQYLPSPDKLHFENATHYILQYQKIANKRILRAEAFYKKYEDLIKSTGNYGQLTAINNKGFGDAKGIEIFWRDKKSINNIDYWVSYSYLDTKRNFLNYPDAIQPPFSARHTASVVLRTFILPAKLQINASYTFASGRPYYDIYYNESDQLYKIRRQGLTKNYNDFSISFNYLPSLGKKNPKSFSVLVLSVTNVPGFKNIYSYDFSADGKRMIPVLPSSKRFLYLGYFISFGIDRTQEAIDSHL